MTRRAGLLLGVCLSIAPGLRGECKGPAELESRARTSRKGNGYIELGAWFGQKQQFACANQALRSALRLDPKSAKANYFLGVSLYSSGETAAAVAPLARAGELDPASTQPHVLLAKVLLELGRRAEAETQWKTVLRVAPASTEALDGLSRMMIADHDPRAAVELLRSAHRDEMLTLDLVSAYGESGMLDEAGATAKEALAKTPGSIALTKALATVYVHQQRFQDAATLLRAYLGRHHADPAAELQYLSILVLTNDLANARPLGKRLLVASPHNFDVLSLNGIVERESEDYEAAREHLQEAVALQPEDYTAQYTLGATLAHLDDLAGAKGHLEKAIALDARNPQTHFQLAAVLRAMHDTAAAQQELTIYEGLRKQSAGQAEAESKAEQARQKLASGDTTGAIALYRQATAATPENALLHYQLSVALEQSGDTAGQRTALTEAVRIDPTFALAENQLGYLESRAGELAKAEEHFQAAVKSAPEFTGAWINLAAALASESRFPQAKEAAATALRLEPDNAQAMKLNRQLALAGH